MFPTSTASHAASHAAVLIDDDATARASSAPTRPHDSRALIEACLSDSVQQVRDILDDVLGDINKGLTADEAMAILRPKETFLCPLAFLSGPDLAQTFVDALVPALQDGRLSGAQITRLLDGGPMDRPEVGLWKVFRNGFCSEAKRLLDSLLKVQGPRGLSADQLHSILSGAVEGHPSPRQTATLRTVTKGSPTDISRWYAEILALYQDQRIDAGQARSLMAGVDRDGWSVWHQALLRSLRNTDATVVLSVVRAWRQAIQAGLMPRDTLRDGLLSRQPHGHRGLLACASASQDTRWLCALFRELCSLRQEELLSETDLCEILDASLDTEGIERPAATQRRSAEFQLATFERLLNECVGAGGIARASAARLLLAGPDAGTSRSVHAAGYAGGHSDIHARLLDDAVRRGDLSPVHRADALAAARRHALAIYPPPRALGGG
jgi:hypothetical protein